MGETRSTACAARSNVCFATTVYAVSSAKKFPPQVYTKDEINRILTACGDDRIGLRNRALIMMGYRCGLRCSEALALQPSDIAADHVYVRHGKGGKSRRVGLPADAAERNRLFMLLGQRHKWAFPTATGRRLTTSYIRNLMPVLARRSRIAKRLHFHGLRHTFAWELAGEGVPMPIIQRALGHSSLNTTAIYLDHLAPHDVIDATRNRP